MNTVNDMIKDLQHSELLANELYAKLPEHFKNECEINPQVCTTAGELIIALHRLEELEQLVEWYTSQDLILRNKIVHKLIDRKDKIREFLDRGYNTEEIVTYFIDLVIFEPKAKPNIPKEKE